MKEEKQKNEYGIICKKEMAVFYPKRKIQDGCPVLWN